MYLTCIHEQESGCYYMTGLHFTLTGAMKFFEQEHNTSTMWKLCHPLGAWQQVKDGAVYTIEKVPIKWRWDWLNK